MNARTLATHILAHLFKYKTSLSDELEQQLPILKDARDRALTQELCYGVLRWLPRLEAVLQQLLKKPLKSTENEIYALLLIGVYQQLYLRIPPHAAISATVEVTRTLKKEWASGLVNAVLRHLQRQPNKLLKQVDTQLAARLAHPAWLLEQLQNDWPQRWQAIAQANNTHPPFTIRVNARMMSRAAYLEQLHNKQIDASPTPHTDYGITLNQALDVQYLPGFNQGWVSVQDGAAQLAASLLDVPDGARVLDACAAPGGKTAHLLERYTPGSLLALDKSPTRVQRITENLRRLRLTASVQCGNAIELNTWWNGQPFDRILLDVPCSASGIIRRHPDIKYLRQADDLTMLTLQQKKLLEALWPVLKPGGKLLYVTCSVFSVENHLQIQDFIATQSDAQALVLPEEWGQEMPVGRQTLPSEEHLFDGFYYAGLVKT